MIDLIFRQASVNSIRTEGQGQIASIGLSGATAKSTPRNFLELGEFHVRYPLLPFAKAMLTPYAPEKKKHTKL